MTVPVSVVHKLEIEEGRDVPVSPFAMQLVDWAVINRQRRAAAKQWRDRAGAVAHGPPLVDPTSVPYWP